MNSKKQLSSQAIQKFKAIYTAEFGEVISDHEAHEMAIQLLQLLKLLL